MCGIFGSINTSFINHNEKLINVSKVIKHRGPDDEGYLLFNAYSHKAFKGPDSPVDIALPVIGSNNNEFTNAFLHRRLSIIDLSKHGHQPMSYADEKYWIILNGEIYNYVEIRQDLIKLGYTFSTKSDTEVVLAAHMQWKEECVKRFNGMWAFAIWDRHENSLFLSRDRFGVKPLYYAFAENSFIFCSEVKGILAYIDRLPELNDVQLLNYTTYGEVRMGLSNEETIFKNIKQLLPGHSLIFKKGEIRISQYWSIPPKEHKLSLNESVLEFKRLFHQSLKYRLRSDVEVGSCLSGGIDSSSIVSNATFSFGKHFHTFSAVWPGESCDESYYIRKVNEKWNCVPHLIQPNLDGLLDIIDREIYFQEIPLPGSSLIAQWFVMQGAKEAGIKVLLDGQGADEVLSGYPRYIIPYINELIFHLKWNELFSNYRDLKANGYDFKRILGIQKNKVVAKNRTVLPVNKLYQDKQARLNRKYYQYNYLPDYLAEEIQNTCLPALLHYEDRNSMAHSVEARVPYLDYQLAEFCLGISTEHKIKGTLTKVVLREAMKEILPAEIYSRRDKIGFSTPIENVFFKRGSAHYKYIVNVIKKSRIKELGILDMTEINNYLTGNEFRLYSLARFIEKWF
jgi:asparagine synthase (glutamine-hydrolysing)